MATLSSLEKSYPTLPWLRATVQPLTSTLTVNKQAISVLKAISPKKAKTRFQYNH
jgi:hypothetical protein